VSGSKGHKRTCAKDISDTCEACDEGEGLSVGVLDYVAETKKPEANNRCQVCPAGEYQHKGLYGHWCTKCTTNQYQDEEGAIACKNCSVPCEKIKDRVSKEECARTNDHGYSWSDGGIGCDDGAIPSALCKVGMPGDGVCNKHCNRFIAKTDDEPPKIVEAERSLDMGDCSAAMAPLILQAHMLLRLEDQDETTVALADSILSQAMGLATPELDKEEVFQRCSNYLHTSATQCTEYHRQRQFYDLAKSMIETSTLAVSDDDAKGALVADGVSGWELAMVCESIFFFFSLFFLFLLFCFSVFLSWTLASLLFPFFFFSILNIHLHLRNLFLSLSVCRLFVAEQRLFFLFSFFSFFLFPSLLSNHDILLFELTGGLAQASGLAYLTIRILCFFCCC
jgi:hypothetical protein